MTEKSYTKKSIKKKSKAKAKTQVVTVASRPRKKVETLKPAKIKALEPMEGTLEPVIHDSRGRFAVGNPGGALKVNRSSNAITNLRAQGWTRLITKFNELGQMNYNDFLMLDEQTETDTEITVEDKSVIKFFKALIKDGNVAHMRFYFAVFGIPTDLKAVTVRDMDNIFKNAIGEDKSGSKTAHLTNEEKLVMLERMKDLLKKDINSSKKQARIVKMKVPKVLR